MKAFKQHLIPLVDGELEKLMEASVEGRFHIDLAFGTGGCALKWNEGQEMPKAVELLGFMRGVLNENTDGAGI